MAVGFLTARRGKGEGGGGGWSERDGGRTEKSRER